MAFLLFRKRNCRPARNKKNNTNNSRSWIRMTRRRVVVSEKAKVEAAEDSNNMVDRNNNNNQNIGDEARAAAAAAATNAETTTTTSPLASLPIARAEIGVADKARAVEATPVNVVIVGGGIVGLTLALALKRHANILPVVYEQASAHHVLVDATEEEQQLRDPMSRPYVARPVGAGMTIYANGLRVLRDLDSDGDLLRRLRTGGRAYDFRRWERHTGQVVMTAPESVLSKKKREMMAHMHKEGVLCEGDAEDDADDDETQLLGSLGVNRHMLQTTLLQAVQRAGIPIHFEKRLVRIDRHDDDGMASTVLEFQDGTIVKAPLVFAADGSKSLTRTSLLKQQQQQEEQVAEQAAVNASGTATATTTSRRHELKYTGTTCLMGLSPVPDRHLLNPTSSVHGEDATDAGWADSNGDDEQQKQEPLVGICFPSSTTSKCHGVFFPTSDESICFQYHFPDIPYLQQQQQLHLQQLRGSGSVDEANVVVDGTGGDWATLSEQVSREECAALAARLRNEGWGERYLYPLENVQSAVRVRFSLLEPRLPQWVYHDGRVVLVGDAAHPPGEFFESILKSLVS